MFRSETSKVVRKATHTSALHRGHEPVTLEIRHISMPPESNDREFSSLDLFDCFHGHKDIPSRDGQPQQQSPTVTRDTLQSSWLCHAQPSPSLELSLTGVEIMTQYFFDQIVMLDTWLADLPQLYARSFNGGTIKHAIHAASLLLLGNQSGHRSATNAAHRSYGRCLKLLNTSLGDVSKRLEDETLSAVLVLHLISVSLHQSRHTTEPANRACRIYQGAAIRHQLCI